MHAFSDWHGCRYYMDRVKRIWYLSPMRAAKVQASLRIRADSPEPLLLAHTSSESRGTFSQKARSLGPLNGWACAVKICHDGMLEDTNSLDGAHINNTWYEICCLQDYDTALWWKCSIDILIILFWTWHPYNCWVNVISMRSLKIRVLF